MKKLYYKTIGVEPDEKCIDRCPYVDYKSNNNTMIGSANCKDCKECYGWDDEEKWVKCLKYSLINNTDSSLCQDAEDFLLAIESWKGKEFKDGAKGHKVVNMRPILIAKRICKKILEDNS